MCEKFIKRLFTQYAHFLFFNPKDYEIINTMAMGRKKYEVFF